MKYPALYIGASILSARFQRYYLWSLRFEYFFLITCSIMGLRETEESWYYYLYTVLLAGGLITFGHRYIVKPEQLWYKGRALSESIKTSSWRYCMQAAPFEANEQIVAAASFRSHLQSVLAANQFAGARLPAEGADQEQITSEMNELRSKSCEERLRFYIEHRIKDQRTWYAKKAGANRRWATRWAVASIICYGVAIIFALARAAHPAWKILPTDPMISIASAIVGWMQAKRFNELASSYTLTAHEIGLVHADAEKVVCDKSLSDFVNEAELAFSREHTQWVARQAE